MITWTEKDKRWRTGIHKIPQRHQLARIVARGNAKLGKRMMDKVNYPIPDDPKNMAKKQDYGVPRII